MKVLVKVDFKVDQDFKVRFLVQDYNPDFDLVIDPQLIYCSYLGGSGDELWPSRIIRDSENCIYMSGKTQSANFPVTPGTFSTSHSGDFDAFVIKLNPTGSQIIFCTFIGGPGMDIASDIKLVGAADDILVSGLTASAGFPTTPGAYQTVHAGLDDIYMLKLNNAGNNLIFSTLIGGSADEQISTFCLDNSGDIYVLGYGSSDFPITPGAFQQTSMGDYDVCVFKLSSDGKHLLHSTFIGGNSRDRSGGIALDNLSNVYISAWVMGQIPTTAGAYDNSFNGDIDIAVCKFNSSLTNLLFSTLIGGPGEDLTVSDVILDNDNNIILVGKAGNGFPTTAGAYDQNFNGGDSDGIVIKLNNTGSQLLYSSFLGSPGSDYAREVIMDPSGNLLITGNCQNGFPTTSCPFDDSYNGGESDCFITKLDIKNSKLLYSSYFGTSGRFDKTCSVFYQNGSFFFVPSAGFMNSAPHIIDSSCRT